MHFLQVDISSTYHFSIAFEDGSHVVPKGLESCCVGDNLSIVATIIMRVNDSICTILSDIIDNAGIFIQVICVQTCRHTTYCHALHSERYLKDVVSLTDQFLHIEY